jgi:hypothetical protein
VCGYDDHQVAARRRLDASAIAARYEMSNPDPVEGVTLTIHDVIAAPIVPQRQCGRCRGLFASDTALDQRALRDWWACPECRAVLFPSKFGSRDRQSA